MLLSRIMQDSVKLCILANMTISYHVVGRELYPVYVTVLLESQFPLRVGVCQSVSSNSPLYSQPFSATWEALPPVDFPAELWLRGPCWDSHHSCQGFEDEAFLRL